MMDCTVRTVGGCALLAVRAVTAFLPARSPRVLVATAFLSRSIFLWLWKACGDTKISKENQRVPATSVLGFPETPSLILLLMKVRRES